MRICTNGAVSLQGGWKSRQERSQSHVGKSDPTSARTRGLGVVRFAEKSGHQKALSEMQCVYCGIRSMRIHTEIPRRWIKSQGGSADMGGMPSGGGQDGMGMSMPGSIESQTLMDIAVVSNEDNSHGSYPDSSSQKSENISTDWLAMDYWEYSDGVKTLQRHLEELKRMKKSRQVRTLPESQHLVSSGALEAEVWKVMQEATRLEKSIENAIRDREVALTTCHDAGIGTTVDEPARSGSNTNEAGRTPSLISAEHSGDDTDLEPEERPMKRRASMIEAAWDASWKTASFAASV